MSKIEVDKVDPQSGTALEIGTSGDTVTVPSGVGLTLTDSTLLLPTTITSTTEVKTNKISPATGVAFALGDSGDTFTVPSGATIVNSGTATGFGGGYTQETAVTASGATISFTGIPAGTKSILITAQNMSTDSGAGSDFKMTIGDSGGLETSGYSSVDCYRGSGGDAGLNSSTSYFKMSHAFSASDVWSGNIMLQHISANFWVSTYMAQDITEYSRRGCGHKQLTGELTQLQFAFTNGDFDNGTINIMYQ